MHDIPVCVLLFVTALALATLLYVADAADNAPDADWTGFAGPFLFVYLLLVFFCCTTLMPLVAFYCTRGDAGDVQRDQLRHQRFRRAIVGMLAAIVILVLFAIFFILLPLQLAEVQHHPHASWTGTMIVLLFALGTLFVYVALRLAQADSDDASFLVPCCGGGTGSTAAIPLCLGGGGGGGGIDSDPARVRTPLQRWTFAYHVTLTVALALVTIAAGLLIPVLNSGKPVAVAMWAVWLALGAVIIVGSILLGMRVRAAGNHDTSVAGAHGTRETVLLALATLTAVLVLVFTFLLLSPPSDMHVLFASLYAAFIIALVVLAFLAADAEISPVYRKVGGGGDGDAVELGSAGPGVDAASDAAATGKYEPAAAANVVLNWESLPE